MDGVQDDSVGHPKTIARSAAGSSFDTRWLMAFLLWAIGISAIVGVVVATSMGQPTVALIIGLVAGAFIAGSVC